MQKILLVFFLLSILLVLFLNFTYGTYFENYEPAFNAITTGEFTSPITLFFFIPIWFYIFPLFSFFNNIFHSANGYSWCTSFFNVVILTSLLSCLYILFDQYKVKLTVVIIAFLIFIFIYIENIILIQNLRISFFSLVACYLLIFLIRRSAISRGYYFLVVFLATLSFLSRLEIGVVASMVLLCYSILFQRQMLRFSVVLFFASLSVFTFYKGYQHTVYPDQETILAIEHAYEDQQRVRPEEAKDERTQLLLRAVGMYIRDDDNIPIKECARIVYSESLTDYIRSDSFAGIYGYKIKKLASLLIEYVWLLIVTFIISAFTVYIYIKEQSKYVAWLKVIAFMLFFPAMILMISVLTNCPHNLIVTLWIAICLLCLVYLVLKTNEHKNIYHFLLIFLVFVLLPLSFYHLYDLHKYESQCNERARDFRTMLLTLAGQKKAIVVVNSIDERDYPCRLFSDLYSTKIDHYYADHFLSRYPPFTLHNEKFFGKGYSSMGSKMNTIANHNNVVYISNDENNRFMTDYMRVFYKVRLTFTDYPTGVPLYDSKPYLVSSAPIE